jgi:hypothetical protein
VSVCLFSFRSCLSLSYISHGDESYKTRNIYLYLSPAIGKHQETQEAQTKQEGPRATGQHLETQEAWTTCMPFDIVDIIPNHYRLYEAFITVALCLFTCDILLVH